MPFSPEVLIAFFLTIFVLGYLFGDQAFFRVAIYLFIGASAGYIASVAWHQVLWPQLFEPFLFGTSEERMSNLLPALLVLLLFFKATPTTSRLGTPSVAFMVGVGTAVAIGGAITGTIIPQIAATINTFDAAGAEGFTIIDRIMQSIEALLMLFGTISTLIYFQFTARRGDDGQYTRNPITRGLAWFGGVFIAITLGVLFAGIYSAALTALIERLSFVIEFLIESFSWIKALWLQ